MMSFFRLMVVSILTGVIFITTVPQVEAAKTMPTVEWSHDLYTMNFTRQENQARKKHQLLTAGTPEDNQRNRQRIINAINAKLQAQKSQLPFILKENADENSYALNQDIGTGIAPLHIMPMIVMDSVMPASYKAANREYFKYFLVSAIDIAFCSENADGAFNILGNIPIHFYVSIPETNSLSDMRELSQAEQARIYTDYAVKMINERLDFVKYKKTIERMLKDYETRSDTAETYRLEDVKYTSDKAKQVFSRNQLMKRVIANIFTSDYTTKTGYLVYPSRISGEWVDDSSKGLYSQSMTSSHSGGKNVQMTMPMKVNHQIILDVSGMADKSVKETNVDGIKAYQVWMDRFMDGQKIEIIHSTFEKYIKNTSSGNSINKEPEEIYGGLLIGAAIKAANADKKKGK